MNVVKATRRYEDWLADRTDLVRKDLRLKHSRMKADLFLFFRATYYRWAQLWPEICADLVKSPRVLAVGDLHVENFGTWRDAEGRLIWGINDFDESYRLPYANDLVRLAVSAHLAAEAGHLPLQHHETCEAILAGYRDAMQHGGRPFVLSEQHGWLRQIAEGELRDPVRFWQKLDSLPNFKRAVPLRAKKALERLLPARDMPYRLVHRVAGLGSLGHARFVAIADWHGGKIAREAKALVASSSYWAASQKGSPKIFYQKIISRSVRCPDPFLQLRGSWIVRRLSPHCSRIEISQIRAPGAEIKLLRAMGWEIANVHLGTPTAVKPILAHLKKQKGKWLHGASAAMLETVRAEWKTWREEGYE